MTKIEKRSLRHVSSVLGSFDTFPAYSMLTDAMSAAGVEDAVRSKIMEQFRALIFEQKEKVSEAKDWIDTIISEAD